MARQQRLIASNVGETAIWRAYTVDASPASKSQAAGYDATVSYSERTITGLFQLATFAEMSVPGGQFVAGDVVATLVDAVPCGRDEVVWRGTTYRAESDPVPQRILGGSAYRVLLRRGQ